MESQWTKKEHSREGFYNFLTYICLGLGGVGSLLLLVWYSWFMGPSNFKMYDILTIRINLFIFMMLGIDSIIMVILYFWLVVKNQFFSNSKDKNWQIISLFWFLSTVPLSILLLTAGDKMFGQVFGFDTEKVNIIIHEYHNSNDISIFEKYIKNDPKTEMAIVSKLSGNKGIFNAIYNKILFKSLSIIDSSRDSVKQYRVGSSPFYLFQNTSINQPVFRQDDYLNSFKEFSFKELVKFESTLKTIVYISYDSVNVGTYSGVGSLNGIKAIRIIARVFVIDYKKAIVTASYIVQGGSPSKEISNWNVFSSSTGSYPSLEEIKNGYLSLEIKE
ncbi:MAG: hypothetical protein K9I69_08155 [Ignavibacteriales bacterium]|nr:hypothetical protein [Ignavibacteriales bacterium]MCF8304808.1 hypothetical protein [Ignavibacteriales bacterium]MCF8314497.1 hypothetical protein [Ignavibacteriales bacterium]MCF8436466.1 hypothetical protein [Ignavibacteriales bacterium]